MQRKFDFSMEWLHCIWDFKKYPTIEKIWQWTEVASPIQRKIKRKVTEFICFPHPRPWKQNYKQQEYTVE
jgi:hypothetical protein